MARLYLLSTVGSARSIIAAISRCLSPARAWRETISRSSSLSVSMSSASSAASSRLKSGRSAKASIQSSGDMATVRLPSRRRMSARLRAMRISQAVGLPWET